jgi:subtilisin family serine protease
MKRLMLLAVAVLATTGLAAPPTTAAPSAQPVPAAEPRSTITLITGDQVVTVGRGQALRVAGVRPGPGRDRMGYLTATSKGRVLVYPRDAVELVRSGRLDERLFDVAGLAAMGYDDAHRSDLPLILGHQVGVRAAAPPGARVTRHLPEIGLTAVQRPRADAATFWRSVSGGTDRIWLDGMAKVSLDQSVPQVGAPQAWQNGHTGKGARVAVLDTGYDRDHPDLAGKVVAEQDFTGNPGGVQDGNGHGTHVASTVAGSGGRYRGVAPDAELMVGKVCDDQGACPDSAILDGMRWAAEQGARVVNLSLGGGPSDGSDPLSVAVNELTERYGTLFVVAAGNFGAEETVSTPAVADAALAVGSVTKQDTPSGFSSRGPRPGDRAVKPDLAAPGTDIVAARAAGTLTGVAVDEHYARLSGTSMATPHVTGAAAILAGSHPDWPAGRLKTVLMGTAEPVADAGVYAIGTGRVDVAVADRATVWADRGSLSFGTLGGKPIEQTFTYHNDGAAPVTLTLDAVLTDRFGVSAPDGVLTAEPRSITVPAHGTASTTVTADPRTARPGLFGGRLTATAGGSTVVTTGLGVNVQAEPRTLTVTATAAKDESGDMVVFAQHEETGELSLIWIGAEQSIPVELPAGRYRLTGEVTGVVPIAGTPEYLVTNSTLFAERIDLTTADASLVVDGTAAEPVTRRVDDPAARQQAGLTGVDLALPRTGDGQPSRIGVSTWNLHDIFLVPSKKIDGLVLYDSAFWQEPLLSTTVVGTGREFRLWDPDSVDFLGDVTAPLVDVGPGRDEDLAGKPLNGAIALFTPPAELPPDDLARRMAALGAAGVALVVLGESALHAGLPSTTGVVATYLEVSELRAALAGGPVSLRMRGIDNSPRGYFTYHQVRDRLPAGIAWSDRRDRLAAVATQLHDPRPHRTTVPLEAYVLTDGQYLTTSAMDVRLPAKFTVYVTPGVLTDFVTAAGLSADWYWLGQQFSTPREFRRGERVDLHWQRAPYGPALSTTTTGTEGEPLPLAYRTGDKLSINLPMFTNSQGAGAYSSYNPVTDSGSTTLSRNGKLIGRTDAPGIGAFDLPAGTGRYELTVDAAYRVPDWPLTTRVIDRWTFTSGKAEPLPLLDVEYDLPLDAANAAPAGEVLTGALRISHQVGAHRSRINSVGLEVSYDDGATWQRAEVTRDTVRIPPGPPGFASLRTTATDAAGNTVTETLIRAYVTR